MDSSLRAPLLAFLCALSLAMSLHSVAATTTAYPTILGAGFDDCSLAGGPIVPTRQVHSGGPPILPPPEVLYGGPSILPSREVHSGGPIFPSREVHSNGDGILFPPDPSRREVHGNARIFDISHKYVPDMPVFESNDGLGNFLWLQKSMKNGSLSNDSEMKMPIHTGTHVDAPGHVFDSYFDAGFDVDSLDLEVLNGPALLVDVPRDTNITAEVMKSLNIPRGVRRVLYRTLNTDRRLMFQKEFDPSYVGFTVDGAKWLAENTDIKLIGLDYLSVIISTDLIPGHLAFLEGKEIILVEALKLDDVPAGLYSLHCLPLRLAGADGSPLRCILIK